MTLYNDNHNIKAGLDSLVEVQIDLFELCQAISILLIVTKLTFFFKAHRQIIQQRLSARCHIKTMKSNHSESSSSTNQTTHPTSPKRGVDNRIILAD